MVLSKQLVIVSSSGVPGANGEKGDRGPPGSGFPGLQGDRGSPDFLGLLVLLVHLGVQDNLVKMAYQDCLVI